MLFSGHMLDMLRRHGSLARLSNQGWEALNGFIKRAIARCSQRGSRTGIPLARFIMELSSRMLLYRLNGDTFMPGDWLDGLCEAHAEGNQCTRPPMQLELDEFEELCGDGTAFLTETGDN
jgi:hypothetical protein